MAESVFLCVAPPDGFTAWGPGEWERWLGEHLWESTERIAERAEWSTFLYQLRDHAGKAGALLEPFVGDLVAQRPIGQRRAEELREAFAAVRDAVKAVPATALKARAGQFYSAADVDARIAALQATGVKDPSVADLWATLFDTIDRILAGATKQQRGVYFGEV